MINTVTIRQNDRVFLARIQSRKQSLSTDYTARLNEIAQEQKSAGLFARILLGADFRHAADSARYSWRNDLEQLKRLELAIGCGDVQASIKGLSYLRLLGE